MLLERKFEDLSIAEQIKHHEDQAGHHREAARRILYKEPKRRVEKQLKARSRQASVDSRKSTASGKSHTKKQNRKRKLRLDVGDMSMSNFAMIPPPCLNEYIISGISTSYANFFDLADHLKKVTAWSYEAFSEGETRTPHSFYASRKTEVDGKPSYDTYAAYVNTEHALVTDHSILKSSLQNLWKDQNTIRGYIYYSCVTSYKQNDTHKEGFITFLFPFVEFPAVTSDDSNFVIGIHARDFQPSLQPNEMPKDMKAFCYYFGNYIIATNVPMKDETATIEESDIETIVKNCRAIYNSPLRLMRSSRSFLAQPNVKATIYRKISLKATKEHKAATVHMQINVPYKSPRIKAATAIINTMMQRCFYQVGRRGFLNAIRHQDAETLPTTELLRRLWVASVWIISTEICRSTMTHERISSLTDTLFKDFERVFFYFKAYPTKDAWAAVKEDNGIVPSVDNAMAGFAASSKSAYNKASAPEGQTRADRLSRESTPSLGDITMKSNLRSWDSTAETTPIDNW